MLKITLTGNYSKNPFTEMIKGTFSKDQIKKVLEEAGYSAKQAMIQTSRHGDITGVGRKSHKVIPKQGLQVDVINTAQNKGFYYMKHIDRGGKAGKGGYIRARKFSEEGVLAGQRVFKTSKTFKKI